MGCSIKLMINQKKKEITNNLKEDYQNKEKDNKY